MASTVRRSYVSSSSATSSSATSSSAASALAKRPAAENANVGKVVAAAAQQAKKRVALGNITNQCGVAGKGTNRESATKAPLAKKGSVSRVREASLRRSSSVTSSAVKASSVISNKIASNPSNDGPTSSVLGYIAPCSNALSPSRSAGGSISLDESMSTCGSMKSPEFEYIDNADSSALASLERRASATLHISDHTEETGYTWKRDALMGMHTIDGIVDIDNNHQDPQSCTTLACDIYKHLRIDEAQKQPSSDYIEVFQKDINASMRAILIDWLVEVAEEYRLVPDTLYLTVHYIDCYLSENEMNRQRLQLLGVACMLIASKYEEICAPQVEEFCYITDNTYFRDEVLQMEAAVLKHLKFQMTAPTPKCFLRRFVRAAQCSDEPPSLQLEFLACYAAELTLLEYSFLCYTPSLVAASAVFLAKFILQPTKRPWNATMCHYTLYKPPELSECVKAIHHLLCNSPGSNLPAIREKYSQHKYKFVAKKYCPPSIPQEYFQDLSN